MHWRFLKLTSPFCLLFSLGKYRIAGQRPAVLKGHGSAAFNSIAKGISLHGAPKCSP